MSESKVMRHGFWPSEVSPSNLSKAKRFSDVFWDDDTESVVWLEQSSGRKKIMCQNLNRPPQEIETEPIGAGVGYVGDIAGDPVMSFYRISFRQYLPNLIETKRSY